MALITCLLFLVFASCGKDEFDQGSLISSYAKEKPGKVKIKNEVTDIDRNVYQTVKIGQQVWMAENLKVTRLNDGTLIPEVKGNPDWDFCSKPAYCYYNDDGTAYKSVYGALYNWYAVNTGILCPVGWHVPSESEWQELRNYLGVYFAGDKLKEAGTIHWLSPNTGTNETGFTALPGGRRVYSPWGFGEFIDMGRAGYWWSSFEFLSGTIFATGMGYSDHNAGSYFEWASSGLSVRCIENTMNVATPSVTTSEITGITKITAKSGGTVTNDGGLKITARGVCWNTSPGPTVDLPTKTLDGTGLGAFTSSVTNLSASTIYYLRAYATNSLGTSYGSEVSFKTYKPDAIQDIEGNNYNIVSIGNQVWMAENLKTTTLNDGTKIPEITDSDEWVNTTDPSYCWYGNDYEMYGKIYGALYNGYSVKTGKLCPTGWHIPSDEEWYQLALYLDPNAITWPEPIGVRDESLIAGGKLKEEGTTHWLSPNTGSTNETGFTAFGGGIRSFNGYIGFNENSLWWSSTEFEYHSTLYLWSRALSYNNSYIYRYLSDERGGLSIRCLKD